MIDNNENTIIDIGRELQQIHNAVNTMSFKQVKLNELFIEVKCKKFTISKTTDGDIPLYGSSQVDKPIKYINDYSYSCHDGEYMVRINKNGSIGYCFRHSGTFALTSDVMLVRPLIDVNNINLRLIGIQLNNLYSWSHKLNIKRFNDTSVYIVDN